MAIENNFLKTAADHWLEMNRAFRALVIVAVTALAITLINYSTIQENHSLCSLFGNTRLGDDELSQIEFALHKSGIHEFETQADRILVPTRLRSECLSLLETHDALPRRLVSREESSLSPFHSPSQLAEMRRREKKSKIEEAVKRLNFVNQAWFAMDIAKGQTAFQPDRYSAIIEVRPAEGESLNSLRIQTISQIVCGHLAALDPRQVVITDLKSGLTYRDTGSDSRILNAGTKLLAADRKSQLEQQIERVIRQFPGTRFQLNYKIEAAPRPPTNRVAQLPNTNNKSSIGSIGFGANQQISLKEMGSPNNAPLPFSTAANPWKTNSEQVSLVVTITDEALIAFQPAMETKFLTPGSEGEWENRLEELKSELSRQLLPLLPLATTVATNPNHRPIEFRAPELSNLAKRYQVSLFPWNRVKWFPTVATLLIGVIGLAFGLKHQSPTSQPVTVPHPLDSTTDTSRQKEAEDQLSRLVDSDPESAAQVLKSWLKDAS